MKQKFIDLLRSVDRLGIDKLIDYLENETDFFIAPASTKYHGAQEGGLLEHSIAVLKQVGRLAPMYIEKSEEKRDSLLIVALLHDVCKANFYTISYRNAKNEHGQWEKVPYFAVEDQMPLGHGEKSAYIAMQYIKLSDEEYAAIRWHMGAYGTADFAGVQSLSAAMDKYPLVLLLQMADLAATYYDKK